MKNKPVVLVIENSVDVTGALKSITRTAQDLQGSFVFKFIIPLNSKGRSWIEGNGFVNIHELPMKEISKRFSSLLFYFPFLLINTFRLQRIVRQESVSIIHVNDLYNLLPVMLHIFGGKIPYVCHIRFLPNRFPGWLFNLWLKLHLHYASKVVTVSQSVLNTLPLHTKIIFIHNELPMKESYPERIDTHQQKPFFKFLYLSNFINGKGQNFALDAFSIIRNELPNWKLRFVGGDMGLKKNRDFRNALKVKAEAMGIFDRTEWSGLSKEVELEYKQADVVINFSESESFSIVCLEALYFGRPLIATDCGGPVEIIDNGLTGILVPNRNILAMAAAMLELAVEKDKREAMGFAARKIVRERFSVENTSFRIEEIYYNALKGK